MDETKSLSQSEGSQLPVEGSGAPPDETKSLSQEFAQVAEKATAVGLESPRWSRHFSREQDLARVREASALGASA